MKMLALKPSRETPPGATSLANRWSHPELRLEMGRKNFVRAAAIAASMGLPANEVQEIQCEALWQMAADRNAPGTERLARQYGFSKYALKRVLTERARRLPESSRKRILAACYDANTGKYLSFDEWTDNLMETWGK